MRCAHNTKTIAAASRFSSLEILFDFEFFMFVGGGGNHTPARLGECMFGGFPIGLTGWRHLK